MSVHLRPFMFDNLSFVHLGIALEHPEVKGIEGEEDDGVAYIVRKLGLGLDSCLLDKETLKLSVGKEGNLKLGAATFKPYVTDMVILRKI